MATPNPLSPYPDQPQTADKAYVAAIFAAVGTFVAFWLADTGDFTGEEILQGILLALGVGGGGGVGTYFKKNKPK